MNLELMKAAGKLAANLSVKQAQNQEALKAMGDAVTPNWLQSVPAGNNLQETTMNVLGGLDQIGTGGYAVRNTLQPNVLNTLRPNRSFVSPANSVQPPAGPAPTGGGFTTPQR